MVEPSALPVGTVLGNRYRVDSLLGRGGFAITYLARDLRYDMTVVIKELAPVGANRDGSLRINFGTDQSSSIRLMGQFREEVATLRRLQVRGIIRPIEAFSALGTAYYVMPHFEGSSTAEEVILKSGPMCAEAAEELFRQILNTLREIHSRGILHRDIKPSNILISLDGDAYLFDFGSARQWLMDITQRHTVEFTPGFAPIEQLSEHGKRGPGTDLYSLCATMFYLLTGRIPPVPGEEIPDLVTMGRQVRPEFANAVKRGLELRLADRPRDAEEMLAILDPVPIPAGPNADYDELDKLLFEARKIKVGKLECPACLGIVHSPAPARASTCIVCRTGRLEKRRFDPKTCPCCKFGILHLRSNEKPLRWCPSCRIGLLKRHAKPLRRGTLNCQTCGAILHETKAGLANQDGLEKSASEWRINSGRANETWECDQCLAQLDPGGDGRWVLIHPEPTEYEALFPDEWARIAAGSEPGAGNNKCDTCHADYYSENGKTTLINYSKDPYQIGESFIGQVVSDQQMRWIAAGKTSGQPGYVCEDCDTEFDLADDLLTLVHTHNSDLEPHTGDTHDRATWRRMALKLPTEPEEPEIEGRIETQLRAAWAGGELVEDVFWKGTVTIGDEDKPILAGTGGIVLGKLLRKSQHKWSEFSSFEATSETTLVVSWQKGETTGWDLDPHEITLKLPHSQRVLELTAIDFANRANWLIAASRD